MPTDAPTNNETDMNPNQDNNEEITQLSAAPVDPDHVEQGIVPPLQTVIDDPAPSSDASSEKVDATALTHLETRVTDAETLIDFVEASPDIVMEITRGRVVYYTPGSDDPELYGQKQLTAHIAEVYDQKRVNLAVLHPTGRWYQRTNVLFRQPSDSVPDTSFVEWMPYQVRRMSS